MFIVHSFLSWSVRTHVQGVPKKLRISLSLSTKDVYTRLEFMIERYQEKRKKTRFRSRKKVRFKKKRRKKEKKSRPRFRLRNKASFKIPPLVDSKSIP